MTPLVFAYQEDDKTYYKSTRGVLYCLTKQGELFKCSKDGEIEYECNVERYVLSKEINHTKNRSRFN